MNCVAWNCRGSGSKSLPGLIKDLSCHHSIDIFVILEPRVSGDRALKRIIKIGFKASVRINSIQFSGVFGSCEIPLKLKSC